MRGDAVTERVRALLDEAISGLEPSDPDPVAGVVARGRAARRRRTVGAAVAVVAVLVGGGFAVSGQIGTEPAPVTVGESARPPKPRQVGDTVVVGDLVLPVPKGWKVVPLSATPPCGGLEKTVLIGGPDQSGCQVASIEVRSVRNMVVAGAVVGPGTPNYVITSPKAYTLRGGEPAWLESPADGQMGAPANGSPNAPYYNNLLVPWSKIEITLRVSGAEQQQIIDSIRTSPSRRESGLELPDTAISASLTMPDEDGQASPERFGKVQDPAKVAAVLDLLRAKTSVVDDAHACANPAQPTARLTLTTTEPVTAAPSKDPVTRRSSAPVRAPDPPPSTIIISLGGSCREAVSSDGGRVRLSDAALTELVRLFGIKQR